MHIDETKPQICNSYSVVLPLAQWTRVLVALNESQRYRQDHGWPIGSHDVESVAQAIRDQLNALP
jgi:hypothetical protein